jgi:PAS domain S-box-containing protein
MSRLRSLRSRLSRQFLALAVLPAVVLFAASAAIIVPFLLQQGRERHGQLAVAVRDHVANELAGRQRAASVLASLLDHEAPGSPAAWAAMRELVAGDPFVEAVYAVDTEGSVVAAAIRPDSGRRDLDAIGLDLSAQPHFVRARSTRRATWSDVYVSTLTGHVTTVLVVPGSRHFVTVELSLASLSRSLQDVTGRGSTVAAVIDSTGHVVAHPDEQLALQQLRLPGVARGRSPEPETVQLGIEPTGWTVVVSQPLEALLAPVRYIGFVFGAVLFGAAALAIAVGELLARRAGREVDSLAQAAQAVGRDQGGATVAPVFRTAEFDRVWRRLQQLLQQLLERERQAAQARGQLEAILDAARNVAIYATDAAGVVRVFNAGAAQLLGHAPHDVIGRARACDWHRPVPGDARAAAEPCGDVPAHGPVFAAAARSGHDLRDWTLVRADGTTFTASVSIDALKDDDGTLQGFVCVAVDVSERLRAAELEVARRGAEAASRAKTDFLSRMSHELRTPLNAVLGYAEILETDPADAPSTLQRERLQHIQHAGWHLVRLIDDVLDLARIESGHLSIEARPVDLRQLLAKVERLTRPTMRQHGVVFDCVLLAHWAPHDTAAVLGDETRLTQALLNLLANAAKYNKPGGWVELRLQLEADRARLSVADSGRGMSATQLEHLFEPFNRLGMEASRIEGTGIGLVICKHLVEIMGGTLAVESDHGRGSTFTIVLPLTATAATDAAVPAPRPPQAAGTAPPDRPLRVLYVEDNEANARLMRAIVARRGDLQLAVAASLAEARVALRAGAPDLLLLDMQLPDGGGEDLLGALAADPRWRQIPVVAVSADATRERQDVARQHGARAYLTKPLRVGEVMRVIDEVLATQPVDGGARARTA